MARIKKDGVKIIDVATEAGVSRATVSRVMSGRTTVDPGIAQRVREAAEKLDYRPSHLARNLSLGRTNTVAVVVPDLGNHLFQQILRGAMEATAEQGYRVMVAETAEQVEIEADTALEARLRCDALILVAPRMPDDVLRELLPKLRPVVLINRVLSESDVPTLSVSHGSGMSTIIDHLVGLGHTDFAYVAGPSGSVSEGQRRKAIDESQRRQGITFHEVEGGATISAGYDAAEFVLDSGATAALAFNDMVAFGLLSRLNEIGITVPDGISVTGFDDIDLARFSVPALTTSRVPQAALGREAWNRLHVTLTSNSGDVPVHASFTPELVVRASTGPVPPSGGLVIPSSDTSGLARLSGIRSTWLPTGEGWRIEALGSTLAHYAAGDVMPTVHSPRPHLHPVTTLSGRTMTARSPRDHRHHYGVSMAVADVDGTSYWGGRTYVEGQGATLLRNHGRQVAEDAHVLDGGATLVQHILWSNHDGQSQLEEERALTGVLLTEIEGWALNWGSRLGTVDGGPVSISSPAVNGRPGAGYGGIFWRLPSGDETVVYTDLDNPEAHGSRAEWVAVATRNGDEWTTLLFAHAGSSSDPWFVRKSDYVAVSPALAWQEARTITAENPCRTDMLTVLMDRRLAPEEIPEILTLTRGRLQAASHTLGSGA